MIEAEDRFLVTSKVGIANTLRSMSKQKTMVYVSKAGTDSARISAVLDVDTDNNVFILDYTSDKHFNQHLTRPGNIHFSASVDGVRVQFSLDRPARTINFEDKPAFELIIPEVIRRIQRREHFRIDIPINTTIELITKNEAKKTISFKIKDISVGGLALFDTNDDLYDAEIGKLYRDCTLVLDDLGNINTGLTVRRVSKEGANPDKKIKVVACEFTNISNPDRILVQSFITRLERQQNARMRGFD